MSTAQAPVVDGLRSEQPTQSAASDEGSGDLQGAEHRPSEGEGT